MRKDLHPLVMIAVAAVTLFGPCAADLDLSLRRLRLPTADRPWHRRAWRARQRLVWPGPCSRRRRLWRGADRQRLGPHHVVAQVIAAPAAAACSACHSAIDRGGYSGIFLAC